MPKLPVLSGSDLVKALKILGFVYTSQKGSHVKLKHPDGRIAVIPMHKEIKRGTLKKGILNPLGISVEELQKVL